MILVSAGGLTKMRGLRRWLFPLGVLTVIGAGSPAMAGDEEGKAARLPVGACFQTRIKDIGPRLEGAPDSGSSVAYASGDFGSSYDVVAPLRRAKVGDAVKLCVVSTERHCPADTPPAQVLAAQDLRTGAAWKLATAEHSCRGE